MATVSELQSEIKSLQSQMERESREARQLAKRIEEDNKAALEALRRDTEQQLAEDRKNTELSYERLLVSASSEIEKKLETSRLELQRKYDALNKELEQAVRREGENIRQTDKRQQELEESYHARLKELEARGNEALKTAFHTLRQLEDNLPVDWFMPGHCEEYHRQLGIAQNLITAGAYEAATGIADNLVLAINIDELEIQTLINKWMRNFNVLAQLIKNEHELITTTCRRIEGLSPEFYYEEDIANCTLDYSQFEFWVDRSFFDFRECHEKDYDMIYGISRSFTSDDVQEAENELMSFLKANAQLSEQYTPEYMYLTVRKAEERLSKEIAIVRSMRSRIAAYSQRGDICAQLCDIMYECNFGNAPVSAIYENDDKRKGIIAVFADDGGYVTCEVHVIPVFCERDGKWYNCIGFDVDSPRSMPELERTVEERIRDSFEADGITVMRRTSPSGESTAEQRSAVFKKEFKRLINGHL